MKLPTDDLERVGGQAVAAAIREILNWGEEKLKGRRGQPFKPKPYRQNLEALIQLCRHLCQKNRAYLHLFQQMMNEPENRDLLDRMEKSIPDGKTGLDAWMTQMAELEKSLVNVDYNKVFPKNHL